MSANNVPKFRKVKRLYETGAKVRNVIFLIYIEDLEMIGKGYGDIISYLDSKHCKAVVSPPHDKDTWTREDVRGWCERHIDPETGDVGDAYLDRAPYVGKQKKPHVHVGICSKSQYDAFGWAKFMSGLIDIRPSMFEKMEDWQGFVRYTAHLDSPDKFPYCAMDVVPIAGADISCLLRTDEHTRVTNFSNLVKFVRERKINTFHALVDIVSESGDFELLDTVNHYGGMMASYFASRRWARVDAAKAKAKSKNGCTEKVAS